MTSTRAMSLPKKLIIGIAGFTAVVGLVLFGGGALMDPKIAVGVEKRLAATPEVLFGFLDNAPGLDAWWSVGQEGQPDGVPRVTVRRKSGPENGAGLQVVFVQAGEGDGAVTETWTVQSVTPPNKIVYLVDFTGTLTVTRTLTLVPDGDGTRVTWAEEGSIDRPAMRWMKLVMPPEQIQDNFDRALGALERASRSRRTAG